MYVMWSGGLRFSVRVSSGCTPAEFRDAAIAAEASGFDQIWTGNDQFKPSGIVPVVLALAATTTIRVGSSVLNPVTLHPIEIAALVANLQQISGGRYLLGLGAGSEVYLRWAGLDVEPPVARTFRGLRIVRALTHGQSVRELPGEEAWDVNAFLKGPGFEPAPIYVGAMGPRMLSAAGAEADGVLALCLPPDHFGWVRDNVGTRSEAADFDLVCCVWTSIDDDAGVARHRLAERIAAAGGHLAPEALARAGIDPAKAAHIQRLWDGGNSDAALSEVDDSMLRLGIYGNTAQVIERCSRLIGQGVRHLSFGQPLGPSAPSAIRQLGEQVLPVLRERHQVRDSA